MFADFSNSGQKSIPQYTRAFAANDSCCDSDKSCKGWSAIKTDTSAPPTGIVGTPSVYSCKRDYKTRICDGYEVWVGNGYDCRQKPKEQGSEEEETPDDTGGGGAGGGGGGGAGGGSGEDTGGEDTGGEDARGESFPDELPIDTDYCDFPVMRADGTYGCVDASNPAESNPAANNPAASITNGTNYTDEYLTSISDVQRCILSGNSTSNCLGISGTNMTSDLNLQLTPAYFGQSGSNPAVYPAVGTTTPITPSGASAWVTDYNSVGYMSNDTIMGGSYSAPSGGLVSTTQGTNPATQVGIAYTSQQLNYDTYSNVTGAGINYSGGTPSFDESTGQYVNATSNTIANPVTLPTTLTDWDLYGTAGASSGLYLDTPTIQQNGVVGTSEVDATTPEPAKEGGLGWVALGLIALKALSAI